VLGEVAATDEVAAEHGVGLVDPADPDGRGPVRANVTFSEAPPPGAWPRPWWCRSAAGRREGLLARAGLHPQIDGARQLRGRDAAQGGDRVAEEELAGVDGRDGGHPGIVAAVVATESLIWVADPGTTAGDDVVGAHRLVDAGGGRPRQRRPKTAIVETRPGRPSVRRRSGPCASGSASNSPAQLARRAEECGEWAPDGTRHRPGDQRRQHATPRNTATARRPPVGWPERSGRCPGGRPRRQQQRAGHHRRRDDWSVSATWSEMAPWGDPDGPAAGLIADTTVTPTRRPARRPRCGSGRRVRSTGG